MYTAVAAGPLALVGTGEGHLHVIDVDANEPRVLYALGANRAAVRFVAPLVSGMVAAGDDGCAIVYDF